MAVEDPQRDLPQSSPYGDRISGGADAWDQGPAGALLTQDYFPTAAALTGAVQESLTFLDSQDAVPPAVGSAVAESIAFADAQGAALRGTVTTAETVTLVDSQVSLLRGTVATAETVTFVDSQDAVPPAVGSFTAEVLAFTDAQAGAWRGAGSVAEVLGFSDTQDAAGAPPPDPGIGIITGADAWPRQYERRKDTVKEDMLEAIAALNPTTRVERLARRVVVQAAPATLLNDARLEEMLQSVEAVVATIVTKAAEDAKQRAGRQRRADEELLLLM